MLNYYFVIYSRCFTSVFLVNRQFTIQPCALHVTPHVTLHVTLPLSPMYPQLAAAERSNSTLKRQLETVKEATAKKVKAAEQRAAQEKTKAATRDSDRRRKSQKSRWAGYQAGFAKGRTEGETEATAAAKAAFEEQLEEAEAERAVELEKLTAERSSSTRATSSTTSA